MDGFDCLGATDTTDDFSSFLKKEGIDLMSKTAEQLGKGDKKKTDKPDEKKKSSSSSLSPMVYPLAGLAGGAFGGALLWKAHRVWGGILGGGVGAALGRIAGMFF